MDAFRLLDGRDINTRKGPLGSERLDFLTELLDLEVSLLAFFRGGSDTHKVLEQFRTGLFLEDERELDGTVQKVSDDLDVFLEHVARGDSGCAETDTTGYLSRGVTRNSVLCTKLTLCNRTNLRVQQSIRTVDSDPHKIANFLNFATSQTKGAEIPENQVVVATAGLQSVTMRNEGFGESTSVGDDLLGVELPFGLSNLEESGGDGSNGLYGSCLACARGAGRRGDKEAVR